MNGWTETFALWLADVYLLSTLLLAVVLGLFVIWKQPVRRLAIARAALAGVYVLFVACAIPGWSVVHLALGTGSEVPIAPVSEDLLDTPTDRSMADAEAAHSASVARPDVLKRVDSAATTPFEDSGRATRSVNWPAFLAWAFVAGAICVVARLAIGRMQAWRLVRGARPAEEPLQLLFAKIVKGSHRPPRLLIVDRLHTAVALGLWRPAVLLPEPIVNNSSPPPPSAGEGLGVGARESCLRAVLAHEWAHIRNGDLWMLAAARGLFILLWAQPLFWLFRRQVRLDQEALADAAAADIAGRHDYATHLVSWAKEAAATGRQPLASAVGLWESPSQLRRRITLLLDEKLTLLRTCSRRWRIGSAVVCVAFAGVLSLATFSPGMPPKERAAVDTIRELGGWAKTDTIDGNEHVIEINMVYHETDDGDRLDNDNLSDEALSLVPSFPYLKMLALKETQATDAGLKNIRGMRHLEKIYLWDAGRVTDEGVAHLTTLPKLKYLHLCHSKITDKALEHLSRSVSLEGLVLQDNHNFTDKALENIEPLINLKEICLGRGCLQITDDGLLHLRNMKNLETLDLQQSKITDEGLKHLADLFNLKLIVASKVTSKGVAELKKSIPEVEVIGAIPLTPPARAVDESNIDFFGNNPRPDLSGNVPKPRPDLSGNVPEPIDIPIIVAQFVMIHDGKIIELSDVEKIIEALPETWRARPHYYVTLRAIELGLMDTVPAHMERLKKRFGFNRMEMTELTPRASARYDAILAADDPVDLQGKVTEHDTHRAASTVAAVPSDSERKAERLSEEADREPIDISIVVAEFVMLHEGKIIEMAHIEKIIESLPDPKRARPHFWFTNGAIKLGLFNTVQEHVGQLRQRFRFDGMSLGSLSPRAGARYDAILDAGDLKPDENLRVDSVVQTADGTPLAGAEIALCPPVDASVGYKTLDIYLQQGRLRNRLDEIVTNSNAAGRFSVYPSKGVHYYILALHSKGFGLVRSDAFAKNRTVTVQPWARVHGQIAADSRFEQSAGISFRLPSDGDWPELAFTQYAEETGGPDDKGHFDFPFVPHGLQGHLRRNVQGEQGSSYGLPHAEIQLEPGATRTIDLAALTEEETERLKRMRESSERRMKASER